MSKKSNNTEKDEKADMKADTVTKTEAVLPPPVEDNLEIKKMRFKDRMVAKRARIRKNMEGMSKKEKTKYVLYYYKWHIFISILVLFCVIYFPITIYLNNRPVGISYAVLNNTNALNLDVFDDYMSFYGLGKDYQIISNTGVSLDLETYDELYARNPESPNFTQFPMLCYSGYYDVIITNKAGMEYCSVNALTQSMDKGLNPETYTLLVAEYPGKIVQSKDYSGNLYDYGIDISDTEFARSLNLSYDDVYICFFGLTDQNYENSDRLLNYIFSLNIDL